MFAGDSTDAEDIRVLGLATVELAIQSSMTSVVISPLVRDLALVLCSCPIFLAGRIGRAARCDISVSRIHDASVESDRWTICCLYAALGS